MGYSQRDYLRDTIRENFEKLTVHMVDYGKIELGTDQSKLLIQTRKLFTELEALE